MKKNKLSWCEEELEEGAYGRRGMRKNKNFLFLGRKMKITCLGNFETAGMLKTKSLHQ